MKSMHHLQRGFGFVGILLLLVVIGAVAVVGLKVMDMQHKAAIVSSSSSTMPVVPTKISSTADLQTAATALDNTNVDQVDVSQLDSDLNALL